MDRSRRLHEFWNWLPAFRAVAETQHLPTASEQLHVSPSALSRTIRLLEDNLGRPLFTRAGRQITLNPDGEAFLAAVRNAMRLIDDGLSELADQQMSGPIRIYAASPVTRAFLTEALCTLAETHPALVPSLRHVDEAEVPSLLLRGELDVAFVADESSDVGRLEVHRVGDLAHGIFCGPEHPLAQRDGLALETLEEEHFVVPTPGHAAARYEGWPPEHRRRIAMQVTDLSDAAHAAKDRGWLVVLPIMGAHRTGLVQVRCDLMTRTRVFALRRPRNPGHDKAQEVIDTAIAAFRQRAAA